MKHGIQIKICEEAKISSGFLSLILSGDRRPSWDTAKRLAAATGSDPTIWMEGPGEILRELIRNLSEVPE